MNKPKLLFYCQHSLGMGHLVRSFRLAATFANGFEVIFINGGPVPEGIEVPKDIRLNNLPPLGMITDGHALISRDSELSVEKAKETRKKTIMQLYQQHQPAVIVIELFPFGRKKFADELIPLLEAAQRQLYKPIVLCSLRDILVQNRRDQQAFEDRACKTLNRYFDAVLLHCDLAFAKLSDFFKPNVPLQVPIYNTGFVAPDIFDKQHVTRERRVIVSAGGGIEGGLLYRTAIAAQKIIWKKARIPMTLIAGPFLPDGEWQTLQLLASHAPGLTLHRSVDGLMPLLLRNQFSISQCGYNTAMELMQSGIKALVVPFQTPMEDEQMSRAKKLQRAGAVSLLEPQQLNRESLADAMLDLQDRPQIMHQLDTNGAENTLKTILMLRNRQQHQQVAAL